MTVHNIDSTSESDTRRVCTETHCPRQQGDEPHGMTDCVTKAAGAWRNVGIA